ncbi:hypothetical protein J6590_040829 [Homalodisca vitripennis]|nr:hypothetical protein J6590_040829 [Homalodisca vitripennis]
MRLAFAQYMIYSDVDFACYHDKILEFVRIFLVVVLSVDLCPSVWPSMCWLLFTKHSLLHLTYNKYCLDLELTIKLLVTQLSFEIRHRVIEVCDDVSILLLVMYHLATTIYHTPNVSQMSNPRTYHTSFENKEVLAGMTKFQPSLESLIDINCAATSK